MQQIVIKNHTYAVIDMKDTYPFAAVQSATEQVVLVRKNLVYHNPQQLQIIEKMSDILYSLDHQHLIAFVHAEESIPNSCSFFYEYVPLTIDKWLLEIGEELLDQLEFQLTSLAGYLTGNGVKFAFDPTCVGLSKEIKIKYFLKEFTVDNENKLLNYKDNQNKIASFFAQLRATQQQSLSENSANKLDRGSFESTRKVDSFGTCESWGIKSFHSDGSSHAKQQPKPTLTGRVEDAKKRSLELLARMKGLKGKPV